MPAVMMITMMITMKGMAAMTEPAMAAKAPVTTAMATSAMTTSVSTAMLTD